MAQTQTNGAAVQTVEAPAKSNSEILSDVLEADLYQSLVKKGDTSNLSDQQKGSYLQRLCESLKLNPLTQPFTFLKLNGKEVAYANRSCTDQLAHLHNITREILKSEYIQDVYVVTCRASMPNGRSDISTGAVSVGNLKGNDLANALMKAETKSKRRVVLSICGLGFLDESEIETIPADRFATPTASADPKRPSKGELIEKAKATGGNGSTLPAFTGPANTYTDAETQYRIGIERLMRLGSQSELSIANALTRFDEHPDKREDAWIAVMRTVLKKLIESELWAYTEEGTDQLLEKFGVTGIDDASRGQLEALYEDLSSNGVLTRFAQ